MVSSEKILVCVHNSQNGDRLVKRGSQLAKLYQCPLYVLQVQTEDEGAQQKQQTEEAISQWKALCSQQEATFIVKTKGEQKVSDLIASTVDQLEITQLIIGHSGLTRWQEVVRGSVINELLRRVKQVDLHVISLQDNRLPIYE